MSKALSDNRRLEINQEYRRLLAGFKKDDLKTARRLMEIEKELGKSTNEMCADAIKNYMDQY